MADYVELLRKDLVEQFKEKPVIDALIEAVGQQLNDVARFYEDLQNKRGLHTSEGRQLDGIGDIVVLSRLEAGELACVKEPAFVLDDEAYRAFLIYKIWKNTNNCTYYDIIKAFRMFWDKPLYYSEDPEIPATMLFETNMLRPEDHAEKLLTIPYIKAAGVGIHIVAKTETPEMQSGISIGGVMGRGYMTTALPEIPVGIDFLDTVWVAPAMQNIAQTRLPEMEEVQR